MNKTRFKAGKAPSGRIAKGRFIPKPIEQLCDKQKDVHIYTPDELEWVRIGTGVYQIPIDNKNNGWFKDEIDAPP